MIMESLHGDYIFVCLVGLPPNPLHQHNIFRLREGAVGFPALHDPLGICRAYPFQIA